VNGEIVENVSRGEVMVESQSDLASLTDYPYATIAFTAGRENQWQKNSSGEWVAFS